MLKPSQEKYFACEFLTIYDKNWVFFKTSFSFIKKNNRVINADSIMKSDMDMSKHVFLLKIYLLINITFKLST